MKYALFVGRWSPFTLGHKYIIDRALAEGKHVCVAIRDTPKSDKDPYTVQERQEMIDAVYHGRVKIIVIPDIESIIL